jgi:hypothetical protein
MNPIVSKWTRLARHGPGSAKGASEVDNVGMSRSGRFVLVFACALVLAQGAGAANGVVYQLRTTQGPTSVTAASHTPAVSGSEVGETFASTLTLRNGPSPQLGRAAWATVGTMRFSYRIHRQCSALGPLCAATADFQTVTSFPGGSLLASGQQISIASPTITIPVLGGTGIYAGARGTVTISPSELKIATYRLELS